MSRQLLILGLSRTGVDPEALERIPPNSTGAFPPGAAGERVREMLSGAGISYRDVEEGGIPDFYCSPGSPVPMDPGALRWIRRAAAGSRSVTILQSNPLADCPEGSPIEVPGMDAPGGTVLGPREVLASLPNTAGIWLEGLWGLEDPSDILSAVGRAVSSDLYWIDAFLHEVCAVTPMDLAGSYEPGDLRILFIPPTPLDEAGAAGVAAAGWAVGGLMEVVTRLRAPGGCPWDRSHTHGSLRSFLIEECYELLQAIDSGDANALRDELGDVLLQVALHSAIAGEAGAFGLAEVADGIKAKMILRHPHVFSDATADTPEAVEANWERIKMAEDTSGKMLLDGVPPSLPALLQAEKVQSVASRIGFDWDRVEGAVDKLREEVGEFARAVEEAGDAGGELGDILFSLVNVARFLDLSPESELLRTVTKFRRRLGGIEDEARSQGRALGDLSLEEMDALWDLQKDAE